MDEGDRTVYVGNLSPKITEPLVYELFLQAGPIINVRIPSDKITKKLKNFGFVEFKDECSVAFAVYLLDNIKLFGRNITVQARNKQPLPPIDSVGIQSLDPEAKPVNNSAVTSLLAEPNNCNSPQPPRPLLDTISQGFNINQQGRHSQKQGYNQQGRHSQKQGYNQQGRHNQKQGYNQQGPFVPNPQLTNQQGWDNQVRPLLQPSLFNQGWFSQPGHFNQHGPFNQQGSFQQQGGLINSCNTPQFDARLIIDTARLNNFKNHYEGNYPQSQNDRHQSRHEYNRSNHHTQGSRQDYHHYNSYQSNDRQNRKNNRRY